MCPSPPPAPAAPASGATGAGHGHVPGGSAPVLASGTNHGRRPVLAAGAGRGRRPVLAAGSGCGQLPAPQVPAMATSRVAVTGRAFVLAAGAGNGPWPPAAAAGAVRGQRSLSSLLFAVVAVPAGGARRATSRALVGVAVVDLFFAAAVPAGGDRRGHVCVGIAGVEILQRGTCCSESISDNAQ